MESSAVVTLTGAAGGTDLAAPPHTRARVNRWDLHSDSVRYTWQFFEPRAQLHQLHRPMHQSLLAHSDRVTCSHLALGYPYTSCCGVYYIGERES
jgi:hypothetical protein